ncbi:hypothetical protein HK099_000327 [Clydaea vesicula]|uniref:Guanylate cyclase domain-containing protein n=1 Tax=Clydaea vesicula TaxID=447962 RepID=A0AAD5XXL1_9FUNG|nr:hypothetical protein HK099_000327 [Clydaea vesicula]
MTSIESVFPSNNPSILPQLPKKFSVHCVPETQRKSANNKLNKSSRSNYDINSITQSTWVAFSSMTDLEKNALLKGNIEGKTFTLHPKLYANKTSLQRLTGKERNMHGAKSFKTYDKPWIEQIKVKSHSDEYVDLDTLNKDFRAIAPGGDDNNNLIDYFFPEQSLNYRFGSTKSTQEQNVINTNIYTKLFNAKFDIPEISKQMKISKPELSKKFADFLTAMSKKLQNIMKSIQEISAQDKTEMSWEKIRNSIGEAVNGKYITLYILEESTQDLIVKSSNWQTVHRRIASSGVFCASNVLHHRVCNLYNVKDSLEEYTVEIDQVYGVLDCECVLSVPIRQGASRVVGILEVINKTCGAPYFNTEDEFIIKTYSSLCTLISMNSAINGQETTAGVNRNEGNADVFSTTASLMTSEMDLNGLVAEMMKKVQDLVSAERSTVFMIDFKTNELWSTLAHNSSEIRIPLNTGIAGYVANHGEICNIRDAYNDSRFNRAVDIKTGFKTRTILCMPMRNSIGKVIGVVQLINKLPENTIFNVDDEVLLLSFASLGPFSQQNEMLIDDIKRAYKSNEKIEVQNYPFILNNCSTKIINYQIFQITDKVDSNVMSTEKKDLQIGDKLLKQTNQNDEKNISSVINVLIHIEEVTDRNRLANTLARYMKVELATKLLNEGDRLLSGVKQRATILYANLRDFNSMSEKMEANEVISTLNNYLNNVMNCITEEKGIVDKIFGDSVLGVFGTPYPEGDDAIRAVSTALRIRTWIYTSKEKNNSKSPTLRVGLGISSGMVFSGSVGPSDRQEYTVMGDTCCLASQLERATKIYGVDILIDGNSKEEAKTHFHLREVDIVHFKGQKVPIAVYEVLEFRGVELGRDVMTSLICYELGLSEYRQQNWLMAVSHFRKAVQLSDDEPSKVFIWRCKSILEGKFEVPKVNWDGTWNTAEGLEPLEENKLIE